jgi:hypothetical protein
MKTMFNNNLYILQPWQKNKNLNKKEKENKKKHTNNKPWQ